MIITDDATYRDDELVYVDPENRAVVGRVEWSKNGNPKSLERAKEEDKPVEGKKGERRKGSTRKHYPFGTFKSMRRAFLEKKQKNVATDVTLDQVIEKAVQEPYWD
ncbi:MAG: hypothetical protein Q7R81_07290 [Candidatus Peregrinibacteria bacterium]|nr:hypothetical protein [Candidatus Peregrinibacteria bacterium]